MGGCQVNNGKISWAYTPSSCTGKELTEDQARDHLIATGETINTGTWWSLIACGGSSVAAILLYFLGGRSNNESLSKLGHIGIFGALVSAGSAAYFYVTRISPDTNGDNSIEKGKTVAKDINQQLINVGKDNQDPTSRTLAAHELGNSNNLNAAVPLKNILLDTTDSKEVRSQSAISLGKLGAFGAIDDLINCLSDPEASVRIGAIQALGLLAEKDANKASKALTPLKEFFEKTQSSEEKCWAVLALSKFPFHQVKDILLKDENLNHADTNLRQSIILSLATILQKSNDSEIIKALASRLEVESEPAICEIIINSFKNITDTNKQKEIVHSLCKFLERNTDEDLQESAIQLLGKFNASEGIDSILKYGSTSSSSKVKIASLKALRQICLNNPGNPKLVDVVNSLRKIEKIASGNAKKVISTIIKEIVTANPSLFTKKSPAPTNTNQTSQPKKPVPNPQPTGSNSGQTSSKQLPSPTPNNNGNSSVSSDPDSEFELSLDGDDDDDSSISSGPDSDSEFELSLDGDDDDDSSISSGPNSDSEFELSLDEEPVQSSSVNADDEVELALDAESTSSFVDDGEPLSNSGLDQEPVPVPAPKPKPLSPTELLQDSDVNIAIQAAKDCATLGLPAIDTLLSYGLTHTDDKVKLATIDTLVTICTNNLDSPKVQEIANRIKNVASNSSNDELKTKGIKAANDLIIEQSIKILKNDPSVQPKTIPATTEQTAIFESLKNTDPIKVKEAAEACEKIGLAAIEPLLSYGLNHRDNNVKIAVVKVLGKICSENPLAKEIPSVISKLEVLERSQSYDAYFLAGEAKQAKECIQSAVRNKKGNAVQQLIDLRYASDPPSNDNRIFPLILGYIRGASTNPDIAKAIVERLANATFKTTNPECIKELQLIVSELKRVTINDNYGGYSGYSSQRIKERAITNIEKALGGHAKNEQAALQAEQLQDQDASLSQRKKALEQLFKSRYTNRSADDDTKDVAGVHNQLIECLEGKHGQELQEEVIRILGDRYTTIPTQVSTRSYKRFILDTSIANELCKMLETLKKLSTPVKGKDDAIRKLEDFVKAYTTDKINDATNNSGKKGTVWTQEGLVTSLSNILNNLTSSHPILAAEIKKIVVERLKNIACGTEKENNQPLCLSARKSALDALTKAGFTFETIPQEVINLLIPGKKDYQALEIEFYKTLLGMSPNGSDETVTLTHQFLRGMGLPRDASKTNLIFLAVQNHENGRTYELERLVLSYCPKKTIDTRDLQGETGVLKSIVNYCQPSYSWTQSLPTPQGFLQALQDSEYGSHSRLETIINGFVTEHNKSAGTPEQLAIKKLLDSCEYDSLKGDTFYEALSFAIKTNQFQELDIFINDFVKSNSLSVTTEGIRDELIKTCKSFPDRTNQEKLKQHLSEKYKKINDRLDPAKVKSDAIQAYKQLKAKHDPETVKKDLLDAYKALNDNLQNINDNLCIGLMKIAANSPIDIKFITGLITCASNNNERPKIKETAKQILSKLDADKLKPFDEKTKASIQDITGRNDLIEPTPAPVIDPPRLAPATNSTDSTKDKISPAPKKAVTEPKAKQTPQEFIADIFNLQDPWHIVVRCEEAFKAHQNGKSGFDREVTRATYFILANLARSDNNDSRSRTNAAGIIKEIIKSGRHLHLDETPMEYIRSEVSKEQTHQRLINKYLELYNLHKDGNTVFDTEVCMLAYTSLSNFASGNLMYADIKSTNNDLNAARTHAKKQLEQIQNPPIKIKDSATEYVKEVVSNQHTHRDLADKYLELYKTHMNKDSDFDREVCALSYEALLGFASGCSTKPNIYWITESLELPERMTPADKAKIMTEKITEKRTAREYIAKQLLQLQPVGKNLEDPNQLRKILASVLDPPDVRSNVISVLTKSNMPIDIDDLILCICTKETNLSSYKPPETEPDKKVERDNDRQLQEACPGITFKKELIETEFQGGDHKTIMVKAVNDSKVRLKAIELLIDRVENGNIPASDLLKDVSLGTIVVFKTKKDSMGQEKKVAVSEEGFISLIRTISKEDEPEEVRLKILDLLSTIFKKSEMNEPEIVSTILKSLGEEAAKTSNSANIRTKCRNLLDTLAQKTNIPAKAQQSVA